MHNLWNSRKNLIINLEYYIFIITGEIIKCEYRTWQILQSTCAHAAYSQNIWEGTGGGALGNISKLPELQS